MNVQASPIEGQSGLPGDGKKDRFWLELLAFEVVLALALIPYYHHALFGGESFFKSDISFYFEPFFNYVSDAVKESRLPLWNPYVHSGMPQMAVPSPGVFYPPNLIMAVLPFSSGFASLLAFHQLVAGTGFFLLVRTLGWGCGPAFAAGLSAALCGYMFSFSTNYTLPATAAWLPMALWSMCGIRLALVPRQIYPMMIACSISIFMMVSAGRPEVSVASLMLVGTVVLIQALFAFRDAKASEERTSANLIWQIAAIALGLLLAAPVVVPGLEWLKLSPRAQGMDVKYVFLWSVNWYDIITMIFVQPFGDLTALGNPYLGIAGSRPDHIPFLPSPLIGPVAITLAFWGFCDSTWKKRYWVLAVLAASMFLIIGKYTVIVPIIVSKVPLATLFRYPVKLIIVPLFCIALAAARGLHALLAHRIRDVAWLSSCALWTVALLFAIAFFTASVLGKPLPIPPMEKLASAQELMAKALFIGTVIGAATLGIASLYRKRRISSRTAAMVINAFIIASLCIPAQCYAAPTIDAGFFAHKPLLLTKLEKSGYDTAGNSRLFALYTEPVHKLDDFNWRKEAPGNANYYQYCRDLLLANTSIDSEVPMVFGYEAAETQDYKEFTFDLLNEARTAHPDDSDNEEDDPDDPDRNRALYDFCRASAAGFVSLQITDGSDEITQLNAKYFEQVDADEAANIRLYKVRSPLPRLFVCNKWHWEASQSQVIKSMQDSATSHFDACMNAAIERIQDDKAYTIPLPSGYSGESAPNPNVQADQTSEKTDAVFTKDGFISPSAVSAKIKSEGPRLLRDDPEHLSMSVTVPKSNFLILSDHYYPGWQAQVDGIPAPIFRANGFFRAIYVSKGSHLIQMDYDPDSLKIGFAFAGFSLALLGFILFRWLAPYAWTGLKRSAGQYD